MRCSADQMLIRHRSFLFTLEHVNIRIKEMFASNVHLLLFIAKNGRKITKTEKRIE